SRLWQHGGAHFIAHELFAPAQQVLQRVLGEHFQGKAQVGGDVQATGQVVLVELVVGGLVAVGVDDAARLQVVAPQVIGIPGDQGIVEVENRECHRFSGNEGGTGLEKAARIAKRA